MSGYVKTENGQDQFELTEDYKHDPEAQHTTTINGALKSNVTRASRYHTEYRSTSQEYILNSDERPTGRGMTEVTAVREDSIGQGRERCGF